jgi:hypothetical protein
MVESVRFFLGAQHVSHIKGLSAFEPLKVIGVDWETRRSVDRLINLLGASTNVSECAAFVNRPAIDVISVV